MITVELDIFSGNPNPVWTLTAQEEKEFIARVMSEPSLTLPPKSAGGLGYRGFTVSASREARNTLEKSGLPSRFYIESKENADAEAALLNSIEAGKKVADDVRQVAFDSIKATNQLWSEYWRTHTTNDSLALDAPTDRGFETSVNSLEPNIPLNAPRPKDNATASLVCGPLVYTSDTNFSFWNDGFSIRRNNCYNYAANYKSNTFAQPGRISGVQWTSLADCSTVPGSVSYGADADGFETACYPSGNELYVCLVLWANNDFHWYRLAANSHWCHKPGQTAARNYDNSGNLISDPATCNRGPYTLVCSYRYFPNGWSVS
ncbi:MAG TPA: hypothetical protein VF604_13125 [Pyrinomonadaceae bacterium]|jgi:hypothetical protein